MSFLPRESFLSPSERLTLLEIARRSIEAALGGRPYPLADLLSTEALARPAGVFVTIRDAAGLRGCIGTLEAREALYRAVASTAPQAALEDPRFLPLTLGELPAARLELSVLSPFEPVVRIEEVELGRHGLMIRDGSRSGLLLPQVPGEFGWDLAGFLDHLCLKAGLAPARWREPGVRIDRFTAEVFSETEEKEGVGDDRQELLRFGE